MSEEILINVTPSETRVALVENGVLQEVHIERASRRGLVGNIYKGRVCRVLPGMQAAFVDVGMDRAAFLHVSDIQCETEEAGQMEGCKPPDSIAELLHEGQVLMVQVIKDPIGSKGARLTTHVSIPSRYLVLMPDLRHVGISQRIEDEVERQRLKEAVLNAMGDGHVGGYIVRTVAEGTTEQDLREDMEFLSKLWGLAHERARDVEPGTIIHEDLPLVVRTVRDLVSTEVEKVRIDSGETHVKVLEFARQFVPQLADRIEYYRGERPIFDLYGVDDEIQRALDRKIQLKSGGYLIIDQTEAMTTIDVNTGAYVGKKNLEETLLKTNLEATQAIARQLRLRNLGGIIIIDFIDMAEEDHRRLLMRSLEKALMRDRGKVQITEMSQLGLVELTRKRTRESLEHVLCEPCPVCSGRGTIKTAQTVCYEIFRDIIREARQFDGDEYRVMASQIVIDMLLDEEAEGLEKLQEFIQKPIHLQVEPLYHQEVFDVVLS